MRSVAPGVVAFAAVLVLAAQNGGFLADTWGWAALPLLLLAGGIAVAAGSLSLSRIELLALLLAAALVAWTALSSAWAPTAGPPVLEAERTLVYLAALAAVFLTGARSSPGVVAGGVLAACVAVSGWALWGRLFPHHAVTGRLGGPIGYANGLGLVAAIGTLLALGFAVRRPVFAAAAVVLVPALVFTFSRGSWVALAAGLAVLAALELRGGLLRLAAALPTPALAGLLAGRASGLTHTGSSLAHAAHDGHRLALELVVLALLAPLPVRFAPFVRLSRRVVAIGVAAIVVAGGAAAVVAVHHEAATRGGSSLNGRLFSGSTNGRGDYWRVALDEIRAHPALGGGAGTWGRWWLQRRPDSLGALDAHSLYLETLAELGPLGLLLLLAVLALPLLALRRGRALTPAAAAYVALLVHAALDWDWELPAVFLAGLLCGGALLAGAPSRQLRIPRAAVAAAAVLAVAAVFVLQVGNSTLSAASSDLDANRLSQAASQARRADRWQPWSTQPKLLLGEAQLAAGDVAAAARTFRAATGRDPGDWELWYQLALSSSGRERGLALARARALNPHAASFP